MRRPLHLLAVLLLVASCAGRVRLGQTSSSPRPASSSSTTTPAVQKLKVGLVTDIGGLNDRSFNQLANQGLEQPRSRRSGIEGRVLTSKANSDYIPNLSTLAQQKYDLVIGVGFLMAEAMDTVAAKFPNTKFAIIDVDVTGLKGKPKNVQGLVFKEQEAGYLAGYMAGLYVKDNSGKARSAPSAARRSRRSTTTSRATTPAPRRPTRASRPISGYSQDFVDQAKCKELALNQIQQGSKVVFQVAGQCGLGAIDAAKEKGVQAIGVDADQAYLGPQVMTSAAEEGRRRRDRRDQGRAGRTPSRAARTPCSTSSPAAWASARPTPRAPSTPTRSRRSRPRSPRARSRTSPTR